MIILKSIQKNYLKTARVFIDGEINSPGSHSLKGNMSLGDLIMEAGGVPNDPLNTELK